MKTILLLATLLTISCTPGSVGFILTTAPLTPTQQRQNAHAIRAIEDEEFRFRHRERLSQATAWNRGGGFHPPSQIHHHYHH